MNVKKEVVQRLRDMFERELRSIDYELKSNKREFKKLAEKSTTLKRERVRLHGLIRDLGGSDEK